VYRLDLLDILNPSFCEHEVSTKPGQVHKRWSVPSRVDRRQLYL
jgi:hypothetical protein